jgi:eukaryotic-like serine/threonine-protein kinase
MPLSAGDKLGPYEILAPIGAGGMGEVYRARDTRLNRAVAVKISKEQFTDRFEREALVVASLNHPHICQLFDVGPNYLVFEFIEGTAPKGPLPAEEALPIAIQTAEALEEAHKHGIVHRDLKPGNILVTARGVKVLDFGLAKQSQPGQAQDDSTQTLELTRAGGIVGTPAYMAPEQLQGKPADARSDIYALGCVLYELLTGARPGRERAPLRQLALEAIVRRCLAEDPARRFQSAAELKAALQAVSSGSGWNKYAVAAAVLTGLAIGGLFFWQKRVHAKPALTDQDMLVVSDFDNKTGDPVFDTALKQALAFQLQQSPFLKAMDEEEVRDTLKRSGRSPDARVTGDIARDICIREGQKATLEGSIVALGSRYLIALQAANCQTGETFAREQTEATGKEHVVDALAKVTNSMRAKLGESLSTIEGEDRAYQNAVTTSSLDALQSFYMGDSEWTKTGNSAAAVPFYRHAVELDPNFAFACAVLAGMLRNVGDTEAAKQTSEKAFVLRDRVTERERLFIEYVYHQVRGDGRKTLEAAELLSRRYPRDAVFRGNLAEEYTQAGEPEKALPEAQAALKNNPRIFKGYYDTQAPLIELNRIEEAKVLIRKAFENGFDLPEFHALLLYIALAEGDIQAEKREMDWLTSHQASPYILEEQGANAAARGHALKAKELLRQGANLPGLPPVLRDVFLSEAAKMDALLGHCPAPGSRKSAIIDAICDPAAAKTFNDQRAANGSIPISGPEAYVRGLATSAENPADAAAIFAQMVDRKVANWGPEYPAAQVGLARAAKATGDTARAKKTYEQFFAFWKDADPGIPLLIQARKEYAALK